MKTAICSQEKITSQSFGQEAVFYANVNRISQSRKGLAFCFLGLNTASSIGGLLLAVSSPKQTG